jgi:hypothetical protein
VFMSAKYLERETYYTSAQQSMWLSSIINSSNNLTIKFLTLIQNKVIPLVFNYVIMRLATRT